MDTKPPPPVLEFARLTGRLVELRPHAPSDAAALFPLVHKQAAVTDMLIWNGPDASEDLERLFSAWPSKDPALAEPGALGGGLDYFFTIHGLAAGQPVGHCGIRFTETPGMANLGYWMGERFWGGGLCTEAVSLLTWLALETLQAPAVEALCLARNLGSQRVLEKNGFIRDTSFEPETPRHGSASAPDDANPCELRYVLARSTYQPPEGLPVSAEIRIAPSLMS